MAKKRPKRTWTYSPRKPAPPPVPDAIRSEVEAKAEELVERHLKPAQVKPPPWTSPRMAGAELTVYPALSYSIGDL